MEPTWAEAIGVLVIVAVTLLIPVVCYFKEISKHDKEVDELYRRKF